ncbi:hypothetical protein [Sphingobium sp.]|uniref:hypothetical protein n=1 Tax=Sphingobium sp. TaxID=1912891 RepID=UPI002CAE0A21|nr:hypothetical protein [Sphingobium sp.]HUD92676.1 hypothetical protein [Sphingobium sp.]
MRSADLKRTVAVTHTYFPEGIRPGPISAEQMNQDTGGGGLAEPSTDAPADTDLPSMPAGLGWTAPFLEQCHDAYIR